MRASRATRAPPWCLTCRHRGARLGALGSFLLACPGCLALALTPRGCLRPPAPLLRPLLQLFALRLGLLLHMATIYAGLGAAGPAPTPAEAAGHEARSQSPSQGAQAGRAPRLPPLQRTPAQRSGSAPLGANPRLRQPLPQRWRRSRPRPRPRPMPSGLPAPLTTCRMMAPICPRLMPGLPLPLPRNRRTRPTRLPTGPRAPWTSCAAMPKRLRRSCACALTRALAPHRMPPGLTLPTLRPCWPRHWPPGELALAATLGHTARPMPHPLRTI